MSERLVLTMAVGSRTWGDFALNLGLSVKAAYPKAKLALVHDGSAIAGLEAHIELVFDYSYRVEDSKFTTAYEHAFYLKTQLYDIATKIAPTAEQFIYLDADVLMFPGRTVDEWFDGLKGISFTAWCNDVYDYTTKTRQRDDYKFWCEPEDLRAYITASLAEGLDFLNAMPQINSSFIYFEPGIESETLFLYAKMVWNDKTIPYRTYKGVKPDELCFNIACAINNYLPHQIPYYPIFFQFASEHHDELYMRHGWAAFGFAGEMRSFDHIVDMYNRYVAYYREHFGIEEEFVFDNKIKAIQDTNPIKITPVRQRTLYRRGEAPNSAGGIFNPDAIMLPDGGMMTIFRKEANHNIKHGYVNESAVPWVHILREDREEEFELKALGFGTGIRIEDFRLFEWEGHTLCNHTLIKNNLSEDMEAVIALSAIVIDTKYEPWLKLHQMVGLPLATKKVEKNWVFFAEGDDIYCIYSLSPYRLFKYVYGLWREQSTKQPTLQFFHYNQFICNSTNPILLPTSSEGGGEKSYLMFFHTKENGIYHHGAVLIDKESKELTHYTRNSIMIKEPSITEGIAKGIVYVSGSVYIPSRNVVRVLFGEADSSACYVDYDKDELVRAIKKNSV